MIYLFIKLLTKIEGKIEKKWKKLLSYKELVYVF